MKYYYYKKTLKCESDAEEYIVRADNEVDALLTISEHKAKQGYENVLANRKYIKQITLDKSDIVELKQSNLFFNLITITNYYLTLRG